MWLYIIGLIVTLAFGLLTVPLTAEAQPPGKVVRLGILAGGNPRSGPQWEAFEQRLHGLGYVEGHNIEIEFRNAEGKIDRLPDLAVDLVRLNLDVIVAAGTEPVLRAISQATSTMPIVMVALTYDPIARGYVAGLARPGGNITGVFFRQLALTGKRLELFKEALPTATRVAVLWDVFAVDQIEAAEAAGRSLGVQLQRFELRDPPYDFERAFGLITQWDAQALFVLAAPGIFLDRARIADLALTHRLPTMFGFREFAEAGGLMAYGVNLTDLFRRTADYVDKILKGTKPADLPVEQPTQFELVINLKTAKALGITIPPLFLFRADEVIQ